MWVLILHFFFPFKTKIMVYRLHTFFPQDCSPAKLWTGPVYKPCVFTCRTEGRVCDRDFKPWCSRRDAAWFAYGTLLGESITRDTNSQGAKALRYNL